MDCDVVVVGAGLAGLRCAERVAAAGRSVVVLEASDAVGGRQRTDRIDGFLVDRGFQVLNPAYPAVRRWVDVQALDLRTFGAGVLVRRDTGLVALTHPLRNPRGVPGTLRSGLLSPRAVLALARWAGPAVVSPGRVASGPDRPVREGLDRVGLRGALRTEVLEPFLAGVLAEDRGDTSDSFVRLLVRMFALGVPGVPAAGIQALPEQLAARARSAGAELRLGEPVAAVTESAVTESAVELSGGGRVTARAVVVAVGPDAVASLLPLPAPVTKALQTWWFTTPEVPTTSPMLVVDGRRRGPVVNAAVVSNAAPTYAPRGQHLVQVTCLLGAGPGSPASEVEVRRQAGEMFGVSTGSWQLLRRDDVLGALPVQLPPLRTTSEARVAPGRYVCGDHRDTASIQGALVSGHRVATAALADLPALGRRP